MSGWQDIGRRMLRHMPSPAGPLRGRGVTDLGRLAAGSAIASVNLAARAVHLGMQTGARTFGAAAGSVGGSVPGAGIARRLADAVDQESAIAAKAASRRAAASFELMASQQHGTVGAQATNERSTSGESAASLRPVWTELAADTGLGPIHSLVSMTIALGSESIRQAAATGPGEKILSVGLKHLEKKPVDGEARFASAELRQSFVAVTTDSGAAAIRETFALLEATLRMAFSDTRMMRQAIDEGLAEMHRLASASEMQDLLPTPMVSQQLSQRARLVVDRAPRRFLEVLADEPGSWLPRVRKILAASLEDADNLWVFLVVYPRAVTTLGTDVGKLLVAGSVHFSEIEAFMEGRRSVV